MQVGDKEEPAGCPLTRRCEHVLVDVDPGHERAAADQLGARLAAPAGDVEDALPRELGEERERIGVRRRRGSLRGRAPPVELVPGAEVLLGRLHQPTSIQGRPGSGARSG